MNEIANFESNSSVKKSQNTIMLGLQFIYYSAGATFWTTLYWKAGEVIWWNEQKSCWRHMQVYMKSDTKPNRIHNKNEA